MQTKSCIRWDSNVIFHIITFFHNIQGITTSSENNQVGQDQTYHQEFQAHASTMIQVTFFRPIIRQEDDLETSTIMLQLSRTFAQPLITLSRRLFKPEHLNITVSYCHKEKITCGALDHEPFELKTHNIIPYFSTTIKHKTSMQRNLE